MPLFHVQDSDRPAYVHAATYALALEKWTKAVKAENGGDAGELPQGIAYVCDDSDLILGDKFLA